MPEETSRTGLRPNPGRPPRSRTSPPTDPRDFAVDGLSFFSEMSMSHLANPAGF